jgi:hypothetical protein
MQPGFRPFFPLLELGFLPLFLLFEPGSTLLDLVYLGWLMYFLQAIVTLR